MKLIDFKTWQKTFEFALENKFKQSYQTLTQNDYNKSEFIKYVKDLDLTDEEKLKIYKTLDE
jgi:hypothetical protein